MQYIVYDLEFNQDSSSLVPSGEKVSKCPYEIIQIGAVKLDSDFNTLATFNRFVKPYIYSQINPFITELTGITTEQLLSEASFPEIFPEFIDFIGDVDSVFCIWGMSDMKELFRNVEFHKLEKKQIPELYINLQPYVSTHFKLTQKKLLKLQAAVELFDILMPYNFHNAYYDAYYTAEILKKLDFPSLQPKRYDPNHVTVRPRLPKKIIDFEKLLQQFNKMYARELSKEEQDMVLLAYKMGRTNQFIK